ncbi:Sterile alpha motif domain-containing protein 11 [Trichoplax sp. H2]|nr:Sterile alpha motif domain-containing protein 11 [Trichoplax sp. H2]|eukprot:RDD44261.1 Sterile alpha motif domain-containing protein 11 [Trichoplax sp. H2]
MPSTATIMSSDVGNEVIFTTGGSMAVTHNSSPSNILLNDTELNEDYDHETASGTHSQSYIQVKMESEKSANISGKEDETNEYLLNTNDVTGDDMTPINRNAKLNVTCGKNHGVLDLSKMYRGNKGSCIYFQNAWITPNEFQRISGKQTTKNWKRSIRYRGRPLKKYAEAGLLSIEDESLGSKMTTKPTHAPTSPPGINLRRITIMNKPNTDSPSASIMGHSHMRNKNRKNTIPRKAAKIASDSFIINKQPNLETNRHEFVNHRKPPKFYNNDNKACSSGRHIEQFPSPPKIRSIMRSDIDDRPNSIKSSNSHDSLSTSKQYCRNVPPSLHSLSPHNSNAENFEIKNLKPLADWDVDDVYNFVSQILSSDEIANIFREHEICGEALSLLNENHMLSTMNIKLGPALKIRSHVMKMLRKPSVHYWNNT